MKALIVSSVFPPREEQETNGGYRRLGLFMRAFGAVFDQIQVLHYAFEKRAVDETPEGGWSKWLSAYWQVPVSVRVCRRGVRRETAWNHYCTGIFSVFEGPQFYTWCGPEQVAAFEQEMECEPDLLFVHRLGAMCAVLRSRVKQLPPVIFDLDEVEHKVLARSLSVEPQWAGKPAYLLQVPAMLRAERKGARLSAKTYVCSDLDAAYLARMGFGPSVAAIPNAVRIPREAVPIGNEPVVLFLGTYRHAPNVGAADRLIRSIWPMIHRQVPQARLIIAGEYPELIPAFSTQPTGVEFPGFVSGLEALYARCRVFCCPIATGGGTRVKLVEAGGYGRPIVSTAIGAEGLDFADGKEILLRETDGEIAAECVRLLRDSGECERLGAAVHRKAKALYDAANIQAGITADVRSILAVRGNGNGRRR